MNKGARLGMFLSILFVVVESWDQCDQLLGDWQGAHTETQQWAASSLVHRSRKDSYKARCQEKHEKLQGDFHAAQHHQCTLKIRTQKTHIFWRSPSKQRGNSLNSFMRNILGTSVYDRGLACENPILPPRITIYAE